LQTAGCNQHRAGAGRFIGLGVVPWRTSAYADAAGPAVHRFTSVYVPTANFVGRNVLDALREP